MTTQTVITKQQPSTRRWLHPVLSNLDKSAELRQATMSDAQVAVRWLNESRGKSQVLGVLRELTALSAGYFRLQEMRDTSPAMRALRKEIPASEAKGDGVWTSKYRRAYRELEQRTKALNKTLNRYVFRPGIGYTVITDMRGAGLVPDAGDRSFRLVVGEWELVEADAILSLVRLYLKGELNTVQLCEMCAKRWLVRAKDHYKFCSTECREAYYQHAPDYHQKKAEIQRKYRVNKKLKERMEELSYAKSQEKRS